MKLKPLDKVVGTELNRVLEGHLFLIVDIHEDLIYFVGEYTRGNVWNVRTDEVFRLATPLEQLL